MSEANVQLVKELQPSGVDLVAATRGSFHDVQPSAFSDDFESVFIAPSVSQDPRGGVDGLIAGWDDWLEAWERYEIEAEEFIDAGDRVVVMVRIRARTHRDGVDVEHAPAAVWSLRDGLVRRIEFYLDRDQALTAAGLR